MAEVCKHHLLNPQGLSGASQEVMLGLGAFLWWQDGKKEKGGGKHARGTIQKRSKKARSSVARTLGPYRDMRLVLSSCALQGSLHGAASLKVDEALILLHEKLLESRKNEIQLLLPPLLQKLLGDFFLIFGREI